MIWVLIGVGWLLVAVLAALLIGRVVHVADRRERTGAPREAQPDMLAASFTVPKPRTPGIPSHGERPSAGKAPRSEPESDHPGS